LKEELMPTKILVTGPIGNVGREVVHFLAESKADIQIILGDCNEEPVRKMFGTKFEFRLLDYEKPTPFGPCVQGIDKMFLMRPPQIADVKHLMFPFLDQAKQAGVKQIVLLTLVGANPITPHYKLEKYIEKLGFAYTHIRAGFFMQNLSTTHRAIIQKESDICIPAGNGKTNFTDVRDIGECIAKVLVTPGDKYYNQILHITGDTAWNYYEIAEKMTQVLGRPITYSNPSPKQFQTKMKEYGFQKDFLDVVSVIYFTIKIGLGSNLYPDLERLLGRKPRTLDAYLLEYASNWK
jgi:uncharacterized protein YbjT (DUF2867 family)